MPLVEQGAGVTPRPDPEHGPHRIYRCDVAGCAQVYLHEDVQRGGCPYCGGRRVRIARTVKDVEMDALRKRGYDPEAHGWEHGDVPSGD
jgi:hypothetical protein